MIAPRATTTMFTSLKAKPKNRRTNKMLVEQHFSSLRNSTEIALSKHTSSIPQVQGALNVKYMGTSVAEQPSSVLVWPLILHHTFVLLVLSFLTLKFSSFFSLIRGTA